MFLHIYPVNGDELFTRLPRKRYAAIACALNFLTNES